MAVGDASCTSLENPLLALVMAVVVEGAIMVRFVSTSSVGILLGYPRLWLVFTFAVSERDHVPPVTHPESKRQGNRPLRIVSTVKKCILEVEEV